MMVIRDDHMGQEWCYYFSSTVVGVTDLVEEDASLAEKVCYRRFQEELQ